AAAAEVVDYLEARERVTAVYLARTVPITLEGGGCRKRIEALTYIADRAHHQYAGRLPEEEAARLIRGGRGRGGCNIDYLETTVRHLAEWGIADAPLTALACLVRGEAG
ncbi:MAG: gamma-glutamylcyclotransferase, partial [Alphaproteobacteria bacterium]